MPYGSDEPFDITRLALARKTLGERERDMERYREIMAIGTAPEIPATVGPTGPEPPTMSEQAMRWWAENVEPNPMYAVPMGLLQTGQAAGGRLLGTVMPEAYARAKTRNLELTPEAVREQPFVELQKTPGVGEVLAEELLPGPQGPWGEVAKTVGSLAGNIVTDPLTYAGGIGLVPKARAGLTAAVKGAEAVPKIIQTARAAREASNIARSAKVLGEIAKAEEMVRAAPEAARGPAEVAASLARLASRRAAITKAADEEALKVFPKALETAGRGRLAFEAAKAAAAGPAAAALYAPQLAMGIAGGAEQAVRRASAGDIGAALPAAVQAGTLGLMGRAMYRGVRQEFGPPNLERGLSQLIESGKISEETASKVADSSASGEHDPTVQAARSIDRDEMRRQAAKARSLIEQFPEAEGEVIPATDTQAVQAVAERIQQFGRFPKEKEGELAARYMDIYQAAKLASPTGSVDLRNLEDAWGRVDERVFEEAQALPREAPPVPAPRMPQEAPIPEAAPVAALEAPIAAPPARAEAPTAPQPEAVPEAPTPVPITTPAVAPKPQELTRQATTQLRKFAGQKGLQGQDEALRTAAINAGPDPDVQVKAMTVAARKILAEGLKARAGEVSAKAREKLESLRLAMERQERRSGRKGAPSEMRWRRTIQEPPQYLEPVPAEKVREYAAEEAALAEATRTGQVLPPEALPRTPAEPGVPPKPTEARLGVTPDQENIIARVIEDADRPEGQHEYMLDEDAQWFGKRLLKNARLKNSLAETVEKANTALKAEGLDAARRAELEVKADTAQETADLLDIAENKAIYDWAEETVKGEAPDAAWFRQRQSDYALLGAHDNARARLETMAPEQRTKVEQFVRRIYDQAANEVGTERDRGLARMMAINVAIQRWRPETGIAGLFRVNRAALRHSLQQIVSEETAAREVMEPAVKVARGAAPTARIEQMLGVEEGAAPRPEEGRRPVRPIETVEPGVWKETEAEVQRALALRRPRETEAEVSARMNAIFGFAEKAVRKDTGRAVFSGPEQVRKAWELYVATQQNKELSVREWARQNGVSSSQADRWKTAIADAVLEYGSEENAAVAGRRAYAEIKTQALARASKLAAEAYERLGDEGFASRPTRGMMARLIDPVVKIAGRMRAASKSADVESASRGLHHILARMSPDDALTTMPEGVGKIPYLASRIARSVFNRRLYAPIKDAPTADLSTVAGLTRRVEGTVPVRMAAWDPEKILSHRDSVKNAILSTIDDLKAVPQSDPRVVAAKSALLRIGRSLQPASRKIKESLDDLVLAQKEMQAGKTGPQIGAAGGGLREIADSVLNVLYKDEAPPSQKQYRAMYDAKAEAAREIGAIQKRSLGPWGVEGVEPGPSQRSFQFMGTEKGVGIEGAGLSAIRGTVEETIGGRPVARKPTPEALAKVETGLPIVTFNVKEGRGSIHETLLELAENAAKRKDRVVYITVDKRLGIDREALAQAESGLYYVTSHPKTDYYRVTSDQELVRRLGLDVIRDEVFSQSARRGAPSEAEWTTEQMDSALAFAHDLYATGAQPTQYRKSMIQRFGDAIRPVMDAIYRAVRSAVKTFRGPTALDLASDARAWAKVSVGMQEAARRKNLGFDPTKPYSEWTDAEEKAWETWADHAASTARPIEGSKMRVFDVYGDGDPKVVDELSRLPKLANGLADAVKILDESGKIWHAQNPAFGFTPSMELYGFYHRTTGEKGIPRLVVSPATLFAAASRSLEVRVRDGLMRPEDARGLLPQEFGRRVIDTVVHELAHHDDIVDGTPEHAYEMARILSLTKKDGSYDRAVQMISDAVLNNDAEELRGLMRSADAVADQARSFNPETTAIPEEVYDEWRHMLKEEFHAGAEVPRGGEQPGRIRAAAVRPEARPAEGGAGAGEAGGIRPTGGAEARPGGEGAVVSATTRAKSATGFLREGGGIRTRGVAFNDELRKTGNVHYVGHIIRGADDLAGMAQVYRDPSNETVRLFFVRDLEDGRQQIVGQMGISSNLPDTVYGMTSREIVHINSMMRRLGADGYYKLHNHPTGDARPSVGDFRSTEGMAKRVPGLRASIVIDSHEYASIPPVDAARNYSIHQLRDAPESDLLLTPKVHAPGLNEFMTGSDVAGIARFGKALKTPDRFVSLFYTDRGGNVRAVQDIPVGLFNRTDQLRGFVQNRRREFGARHVFAYHSDGRVIDVNLAIGRGIVDDFVSPELPEVRTYPRHGGPPPSVIEHLVEEPRRGAPMSLPWRKGTPGERVAARLKGLTEEETRKQAEAARSGGTSPWELRALAATMTPEDIRIRSQAKPQGGKLEDGTEIPDSPINFQKFEGVDPEILAAFHKRLEQNGALAARAERVMTFDQMDQAERALLGVRTPAEHVAKFGKNGGPLFGEVGLMKTIVRDRLTNLAAAEAERDRIRMRPGEEDAKRLAQDRVDVANAELSATAAYFSGGRASPEDLGRALAGLKRFARELSPETAFEEDFIKSLVSRRVSKDQARALLDLFYEAKRQDDWGGFEVALRKAIDPSMTRMLLEAWKANMLGYPSQIANVTSNVLMRGLREGEQALSAGLDAVRSGITGKPRERFVGETWQAMRGMRRAMMEAFPAWWAERKSAVLLKPQSYAKLGGGSKLDYALTSGAIPGKLGRLIRQPFLFLESDDAFFKHLSRVSEYYRVAYRKIQHGEWKLQPGEDVNAAVDRIGDTLARVAENPMDARAKGIWTKELQAITEEAAKTAKRDTYQSELGIPGQTLTRLANEYPALQLAIPFIRAPANITKEALKRTPLGFYNVYRVWKEAKASGKRGPVVDELAKTMLGTALMGVVASAALNGEIEGGGPNDPKLRAAKESTGWLPYSFKIGDAYYSYGRLEPFASLFGTAADLADAYRRGDFRTANKASMTMMGIVAKNFSNKTFLQGMSNLVEFWTDPQRNTKRFSSQMLSSAVPNILGIVPVGNLARALDNQVRDVDPMSFDVLQAKIPVWSKSLPSKKTPTGEPLMRHGPGWVRLWNPVYWSPAKKGPAADVATEMDRLNFSVSAPAKEVQVGKVRVPLTPEERAALERAHSAATTKMAQIIRTREYQSAPDNDLDPRYEIVLPNGERRKTKVDLMKLVYRRYHDPVLDRIRPYVRRRAVGEREKARGRMVTPGYTHPRVEGG